MVKALHITGVLLAILAGFVVVFPAVYAARTGGRQPVPDILKSPSVVDTFKKSQAGRRPSGQDTVSPLVKQADAFARYLNPAAAPAPTVGPSGVPAPIVPPIPSDVRFTLVGTSFYSDKPTESLAFLSIPGEGFRWVKQGGTVGRTIIEEVRDGVVVARTGTVTNELQVQQEPVATSLMGGTGLLPRPASGLGGRSSFGTASRMGGRGNPAPPAGTSRGSFVPPARPTPAPPQPTPPQISEEEKTALNELVNRLKTLQKGQKSDKTDSAARPEDANAAMNKLISDFRSQRGGTSTDASRGTTSGTPGQPTE